MTYSSVKRLKQFTQVDPEDLSLTQTEIDGLMSSLLGQAKDRIDAYCHRQKHGFDYYQDQTLTLDGKNGDKKMLYLPSPVHSVSQVKENGTTLDLTGYEWKSHGSLIRTGGSGRRDWGVGSNSQPYSGSDPPGLQSRQKSVWREGYNNITVTLTFGYHPHPADPEMGFNTDQYALPRDILKAELKLADHTLQGLLAKRENTTIQTDDMEVSLNAPVSMTEEVKMDLSKHRTRRLIG